jgi:mono/diheme cytochrome c family protein
MLVWVIILFWLLVGFAVFGVAMSGGRGKVRRPGEGPVSDGSNRVVTIGAAVVLLGFGIALPAVVIANGGEDRVKEAKGGVDLNDAQAAGREEFIAANCHQCHTLAASNAVGRVGPNLDEMRPPKELILDAIEKGRARGNGQMPANLLQGEEAENVAEYVAAVAGR